MRGYNYFIIEHPTRGTFREQDGEAFRWSWSGARNDPDKAQQFYSLAEAQAMLARMPRQMRAKARILRAPRRGEIQWMETSSQGP